MNAADERDALISDLAEARATIDLTTPALSPAEEAARGV